MLLFEREFFALKDYERLLGKAINLRSEGRSNAERKIKYALGKSRISLAKVQHHNLARTNRLGDRGRVFI